MNSIMWTLYDCTFHASLNYATSIEMEMELHTQQGIVSVADSKSEANFFKLKMGNPIWRTEIGTDRLITNGLIYMKIGIYRFWV